MSSLSGGAPPHEVEWIGNAGFERAPELTNNRYTAGVVGRVDVLQAGTPLRSACADAGGLARQRAALEHAIAVLVGESPSTFALATAPWGTSSPQRG